MVNTVNTSYQVAGQRDVVLYYTLVSDGTQETATVLYNSATVHSTYLLDADSLNCSIQGIKLIVQSAAAVIITLYYDATTDVLAIPFPNPNYPVKMCFKEHGGLKNYAGVGRTGNILITTTGLAAGDKIMLVLDVRPTA
jgi:hypothetical protein